MCNIDALYEAYHKHTGYPETEVYHTQKLRLVREAIRIHLKTCPECRFDGMHSNYNLGMPDPRRAAKIERRRKDAMKREARQGITAAEAQP